MYTYVYIYLDHGLCLCMAARSAVARMPNIPWDSQPSTSGATVSSRTCEPNT